MIKRAMTRGELLNLLTEEAKRYRRQAFLSIERNRNMNNLSEKDFLQLKKNRRLAQRMIDAVLADFISVVGEGQGIDYGLYTKYLKSADRA